MLKKPGILSQIRFTHSVHLPRFRLRSPLGMALLTAPTLAVLAAVAVVPELPEEKARLSAQPLALALSENTEASVFARSETVARGDTVAALLDRLGIQDEAALGFIQSQLARSLGDLSVGEVIQAQVSDTGALRELRFRPGIDREVIVKPGARGFIAEERPLELTLRLETRGGAVSSSLFGSFDRADVPDNFARQFIDIFAGDIDFHRGIKRGDRFSLVYEVWVDSEGSPVKAGRIVAASFTHDGKEHKAIAYTRPDGKTEYFTPTGESLKRAFLKNPVEFSRISSGFTEARLHPVLQTLRAHKGVDYAAPTGSKVLATADGKVEFIGTQGGYGNVIILRHDQQYSTVYGHLNGFTKGLKVGSRVEQGQVIGFVGMTGLASGPHLHYEFKVKGVQIDPLSTSVPLVAQLSSQERTVFAERASQMEKQLAMQTQQNTPLFE